jgi:hypothetical protein
VNMSDWRSSGGPSADASFLTQARYGIDDPNPEQYRVAFDEIRQEPERFERYREHISILRMRRNAAKGPSRHSKAGTSNSE